VSSSMIVVSFKIDEELLRELDELARKKRRPRSELIRAAIRQFLSQEKPKRVVFVSRRIRIYDW